MERALLHIRAKGLCPSGAPLLLSGHSSGAHISMLYLLEALNESKPVLVDGFIALSGVFDIGKHYLWESARGAHEVSPMKAAALGEQSFAHVSPTCLLRDGKISNVRILRCCVVAQSFELRVHMFPCAGRRMPACIDNSRHT